MVAVSLKKKKKKKIDEFRVFDIRVNIMLTMYVHREYVNEE